MFFHTSRPLLSLANAGLYRKCIRARPRWFISLHGSFPATLLRLNAGPTFKQFNFERQSNICGNSGALPHDIGWSKLPSAFVLTSNTSLANCVRVIKGASLMPNTFKMQEIIRTAVDNYEDDVEEGLSIERPFLFIVPKGTYFAASSLEIWTHIAQRGRGT